jgi:S-adenosyl-l-methionine hydroxide adenosyltransferase
LGSLTAEYFHFLCLIDRKTSEATPVIQEEKPMAKTSFFHAPNHANPAAFIVNDCRDANAQGRQIGELLRCLDCSPAFLPVQHELEAAITIVDLLNTFRGGKRGLILSNVAPRKGTTGNGTQFGYFRYGAAVVVTTVTDTMLSLVANLEIVKAIKVLEIEQATRFLVSRRFVDPDDFEHITQSQFRSAMFAPPVGAYLLLHDDIPAIPQPLNKLASKEIEGAVCFVDNFGNCKLASVIEEGGEPVDGTLLATKLGGQREKLPFYRMLASVPDSEAAITRGSSGIGAKRFLEVVVKGGSASKEMKLGVGDRVL